MSAVLRARSCTVEQRGRLEDGATVVAVVFVSILGLGDEEGGGLDGHTKGFLWGTWGNMNSGQAIAAG